MKVLILSSGTGGGHNAAAKAIKEALEEKGASVDICEYLELADSKYTKFVTDSYMSLVSNHKMKLYGGLYKLGEIYSQSSIVSPIYGVNSLTSKNLLTKVEEYDYVVTTHLFAGHALTGVRKEYGKDFMIVATDYLSVPFWNEVYATESVIPTDLLKKEFENKKKKKFIFSKKDKTLSTVVLPYGIPVSKKFSKRYNKTKILEELELNKKDKYILILTGSMGLGNNIELIHHLLKGTKDVKYILACGTNEKLYSDILEEFPGNDRIKPIKYTEDIHKYMYISEFVLTKPGGLSTTELAVMRKAIVHISPIPGVEEANADFFEKYGMSLNSKNIDDIVNNVNTLLTHPHLIVEMENKQKKNIKRHASEKIANYIFKNHLEVLKRQKNKTNK